MWLKKSKCGWSVFLRVRKRDGKERWERREEKKSWVTEMLVCMIWFLFTPLSVPGEREMLTDEGRQKSDEGLERGVNELFPQAVLLTMRVSIEPLMTGGCSIAHTPASTPPLLSSPLLCSLYVATHRLSESVACTQLAVSSYSPDRKQSSW